MQKYNSKQRVLIALISMHFSHIAHNFIKFLTEEIIFVNV